MHVISLAQILVALTGSIASPAPLTIGTPNCGPPLQEWTTTRTDRAKAVNTLVIHGKKPFSVIGRSSVTWNGASVTSEQVRKYVGVTKAMSPVPSLLLVVSPGADCTEVQLYRQIIDDALDCGSDQCVEVNP